jgi:AcrR family transcriptional regulator
MLVRVFGEVLESLSSEGHSFHDVKVEKLIKAAGISRATFYSYFDDKADLLLAVSEDLLQELLASGHGFHQLPTGATKADLRESIRAPFAKYVERRATFRALVHLWHTDPRIAEQQQRVIDQTVTNIATQIVSRQNAGDLDPGLDPVRIATWLTWMLERGAYHLTGPTLAPDLDAWIDAATDLIWGAIYQRV